MKNATQTTSHATARCLAILADVEAEQEQRREQIRRNVAALLSTKAPENWWREDGPGRGTQAGSDQK